LTSFQETFYHLDESEILLALCCIVISARPTGLARYYHRAELSALITSQLKIKLIQGWRYGDSKAEDLQRLPYSKRALFEEI